MTGWLNWKAALAKSDVRADFKLKSKSLLLRLDSPLPLPRRLVRHSPRGDDGSLGEGGSLIKPFCGSGELTHFQFFCYHAQLMTWKKYQRIDRCTGNSEGCWR